MGSIQKAMSKAHWMYCPEFVLSGAMEEQEVGLLTNIRPILKTIEKLLQKYWSNQPPLQHVVMQLLNISNI